MGKDRDTVQARKEIRKARRARAKADLRMRTRVERQLAADGVAERVEACKAAMGRPGTAEAIDVAIREHQALRGMIKDYETLRSVVSTALSARGVDLRDVMLKFAWDGKKLSIFAGPTLDSVRAAATALGVEPEDAFRGMLAQ